MTKPPIISNRRVNGLSIRREHAGEQGWWRPYAIGAVVAVVALLVMIWQLVIRGPFVAADWPIHEYLSPLVSNEALKVTLDWLSRPGQRWFTLPVLLAVGTYVSWRQRRIRPLIAVVVGLATAYLVGKWTKDGLGRTAPFTELDILHSVGEAFPSGHVANATYTWALITLLLFGRRGLWPNRRRVYIGFAVTAGLVVLVGAIMVINDYHWLTDIPGGVAVGFIALMAALLTWGPADRIDEPPAEQDQNDSGVGPAAPGSLSQD